jgi:hypothetical protein
MFVFVRGLPQVAIDHIFASPGICPLTSKSMATLQAPAIFWFSSI